MPESTRSLSLENADIVPSERPGMGAIPYDEGTTFRVWAPFAEAVLVAGSFNDWSEDETPLAREEDGSWSADVPGAGPGDEYKFIVVTEEETIHRNDPYARQVTSSIGNALIYDPHAYDWGDDDYALPPWNEIVLYEMHVGTFHVEKDEQPGDLSSSGRRLDYLRDLGVNVVELMPVAEFPGDYSWGYNPAHPFAVESAYGGPDALKQFVRDAHSRGIGVILDVVYNHFGPSDLDLWRFDGWAENEGGGIYFYNDHRAETPWGETRPDFGRPEVRRYIRDNVMMWLDEFRLDGLRWDGTVFIRHKSFFQEPGSELPEGWSLMQEINQEVKDRLPNRLSIAEDLQEDEWITKDVGAGGAGFDMQWDAGFVHPVRGAIISHDDAARDLDRVVGAIQKRYNDDAFERLIYIESHDEVANGCARVPHEINPEDAKSWESQKRSTLGAGLVFTSPGVPMLFQGQELLEDEWFCDTDPIDWELLDVVPGIHRMYHDLIALRRNLSGTTRGLLGQHVHIFHVNHEAGLIAFHRKADGGPGDDVVIVANFQNRAHDPYRIGFPAEGSWKLRFNSDSSVYNEAFGKQHSGDVDASGEADGLPASAEIAIGPYTVLIYSQDPH
jgi:1,4-alpha-glucan branching enzyme